MGKWSGLILYKYTDIILDTFAYIYTHWHAHKLTLNACTLMNEYTTSVSTPYYLNQALQTAMRDENITGKQRKSNTFLSE